MGINLFTSFYVDKNESRNNELIFCFDKNVNQNFDNIVFLIESDEEKSIFINRYANYKNVKAKVLLQRPTFNDFFEVMDEKEYSNDINILSNSDIFFLDLESIKNNIVSDPKFCYALSRWDYYYDHQIQHFCRADSQDTWIFNGNPKFRLKDLDFTMGVAGCDNRLAHELRESGFNVLNPSKTIKTYHYHNSEIRNYIVGGQVIERIPPPYHLVEPF